MLAEERYVQLVEWSRREGRIGVSEAADRLHVAIETVRRDLDTLQRRGLIRRVHGGAIAVGRLTHESNWHERQSSNVEAKKRIAEVAAQRIPDEGAIFVDGGTTTEALAPFLLDRPNLLVITNSIPIGNIVAQTNTQIFLLGGQLRSTSLTSLGTVTVDQISNFRAEMVFLGANGVDEKMGFTTNDWEEASAKRAFIKNAQESVVLADSTKFGSIFPVAFSEIDGVDRLITNIDADKDSVEMLLKKGLEIELV